MLKQKLKKIVANGGSAVHCTSHTPGTCASLHACDEVPWKKNELEIGNRSPRDILRRILNPRTSIMEFLFKKQFLSLFPVMTLAVLIYI